MNITEYVSAEVPVEIYQGKMTILEDYKIVNADDKTYQYLGKNSVHPITSLIHPDDLQMFLDAIALLEQSRQHITFRLRDSRNVYRCMYAVLKYNMDGPEGVQAIDVDLMDIMVIYERYRKRYANVVKYRKIMSLSENLYMEYHYAKRSINIFEYVNGRSIELFQQSIDELYEDINSNQQYTSKQKLEFDVLYSNLTNEKDNIDLVVDGMLFGIGKYALKLNGGILYQDGKKEMLIAVITKMDYADAEREEKYYLTSYAMDVATSAFNKRAISELTMDLLAKAGNKKIYMVMMDLDDFKGLNDTYGHMVGDEVLAKIVDVMKSVIGKRGYVGRFGGDEFFIVTDRMEDDQELLYALKAIRKNIEWSCQDLIPGRKLTTSIGIAKYPENGRDYDTLFKIADTCLYIAKAKGKNRYILYNPELHGDVEPTAKESRFGVSNLADNYYKRCLSTCEYMNRIRNLTVSEGLDDIIEDICQLFEIDAVSIYKGENLKRIYSFGEYEMVLENAAFLAQPEFQSLFNGQGMAFVNRILTLSEKYPEIYESLNKQGIFAFLLVKGENAMVAFDVFERHGKWSENEKGLLLMLGKTLLERV